MYKVSIIIACFNSEVYISDAIESALSQCYDNIELIVVDGFSKDSTMDIVESFGDRITYISEPDKGIADAWNKGLAIATGEYIYFLNSDDFVKSDFISNIMSRVLTEQPDKHLYYGNTDLLDSSGQLLREYKGDHQSLSRYKGFGFYFTSLVVPRTVFSSVGGFNINIKIAIDTEWLFRAEKHGVEFINHEQTNMMRMVGVSVNQRVNAYREYFNIMQENGYNYFMCEIFFIRLKLIQFLRGIYEKD
ncbi:glycosyltransferase [Shewanella frigidimarina]|uniref:glycosyltransferase n=1 Tax=Shewanella frigidimarina TaxID=56812 RepID=UPI003FA136F9|tara:strand:- start:3109 stop:3849 length:741 start_codon:yes stop_codon:yes gene_type:complete